MARTITHIVPILAGALLLASCVSFGAKAPPSMLLLTATAAVADGTSKVAPVADALVISMPDSPRKLETNRVPVQIDASNLAYLKDAVWTDKPARLMQQLLMEVVAARNNVLVLNEPVTGGRAGSVVAGQLIEFGLDARTNQAVVVYDAILLRSGQPVEKRRFEARENVSTLLPVPAGAALNRAANTVADSVAKWLAAPVKGNG